MKIKELFSPIDEDHTYLRRLGKVCWHALQIAVVKPTEFIVFDRFIKTYYSPRIGKHYGQGKASKMSTLPWYSDNRYSRDWTATTEQETQRTWLGKQFEQFHRGLILTQSKLYASYQSQPKRLINCSQKNTRTARSHFGDVKR